MTKPQKNHGKKDIKLDLWMALTRQRKFGKTKLDLGMALTRQRKFGKTKVE